jgi:hypothetical protein
MDKNIILGFRQLQSLGSWAETAATVSLAKAGTLTSNAIDISQTQGIIQIQAYHASDGAATLLVEILESVDGITFVLNASEAVAALAKTTTALYNFDAKANRFIKIKITENNIAATVVTLSLATR